MADRLLFASLGVVSEVESDLYVYTGSGVVAPTEEAQRLLNYLPTYMQDGPIVRRIFEALGRELQRAEDAKRDLEQQLNLMTATWGLDWWEQMVGIAIQSDNDDYVSRRALVRASFAGTREESEFYFVERIRSMILATTGVDAPPTILLLDPNTNPYEMDIEVAATLSEDEPAWAPTIAAHSGTGITPLATVKYRVTFLFSSGETLQGLSETAPLTLTGANGQVTVSNIPISSSPECLGRRVYRSQNGVRGGAFWHVQELLDNTTTSFVDNYLTSTIVSPGTDPFPTKSSAGTLTQQRLEDLIARTKPAHMKHTLSGGSFRADISQLDEDEL